MTRINDFYTRALAVIPSDNSVIPSVHLISEGVNTSVQANKLISASGTFISSVLKTGDVVYNITTGAAATILTVDSQIQLTLNSNIFGINSCSFRIYQQSAITGPGNSGCSLFIGGAGDISMTTSGGDSVILTSVSAGTMLCIRALSVKSTGTTSTNIVALW